MGLVPARAEDEGRVVAETAAIPGGKDEVVLLDLALTALPPCLDDGFAERGHAPHVVAREFAAASIGWERAARAEFAVLDEGTALALAAETVVLQRDERRVGVAVVELADVDLLG